MMRSSQNGNRVSDEQYVGTVYYLGADSKNTVSKLLESYGYEVPHLRDGENYFIVTVRPVITKTHKALMEKEGVVFHQ